jgi:membrane fusion protein, copper/silver efflux system
MSALQPVKLPKREPGHTWKKHGAPLLFVVLMVVLSSFTTSPGFSQSVDQPAAVKNSTGARSTNTETQAKAKSEAKWTCPMHPHYISDDPGTCPICGMDLVKLQTPGDAQAQTQPKDRSPITIAPETMQNMGVRISKAEETNFGRIIRSFGRVSENERLQTELTARLEGWIEDLRIQAVGDQVRKGDLLFTLYAPEYIVSQRDLVDALKGRDRTRIESIKTRLSAFGMQDQAIRQIVKTRKHQEFVPFYAERDGTVAMIELRPGSYVKRGTMMTRIQDFSQVWLMVSVSEKDLSFIKIGTPARVTFPNIPGREVFARVEYVYPTVDPKTRTGQVRLVIDNADGKLRPGAYADVAFDVEIKERLAVPTEAILKSGSGRYVVASLGQGRFESRAVTTGLTTGRWTEVKGEITEGDEIVVSGQFLIDSESALRESFQKLQRLQLPLSLLKLDNTQFAMIDHMVDAALYIHEALIDGYDIDPKQLDPAIEIKSFLWPAFQHTRLAFVMTDAVGALELAKSAKTESELKSALAKLVEALKPWLLEGAPQHYNNKNVLMFKDHGSDHMWLQLVGKPTNPYGSGHAMEVDWPDPKDQPAQSQPELPASDAQTTRGSSHVGH